LNGVIVTAPQLLEASFKPDALDQHVVGLPLFSDISDDELLMSFNDENNKPSLNINVHSSPPFRNPVSSGTVAVVQGVGPQHSCTLMHGGKEPRTFLANESHDTLHECLVRASAPHMHH